jgi:hypothetical protein
MIDKTVSKNLDDSSSTKVHALMVTNVSVSGEKLKSFKAVMGVLHCVHYFKNT